MGQDAIPGQAHVQRFEQGRIVRQRDLLEGAIQHHPRFQREAERTGARAQRMRQGGGPERQVFGIERRRRRQDAIAIAHQLQGQAVPRFAAGCAAGDQPVFVQVEVIDQAQLARLRGRRGGTGRARRAARADRHQAGVHMALEGRQQLAAAFAQQAGRGRPCGQHLGVAMGIGFPVVLELRFHQHDAQLPPELGLGSQCLVLEDPAYPARRCAIGWLDRWRNPCVDHWRPPGALAMRAW